MPDSPVATLNVVYLARLREVLGRAGETLPLTAGPTTVGVVLDTLRARDGEWARELGHGRAVRVAVNHVMAGPQTPVRAGDELAVFPPVTGG